MTSKQKFILILTSIILSAACLTTLVVTGHDELIKDAVGAAGFVLVMLVFVL
jgi:hypothetical protein